MGSMAIERAKEDRDSGLFWFCGWEQRTGAGSTILTNSLEGMQRFRKSEF
jgi:hypothetical protein